MPETKCNPSNAAVIDRPRCVQCGSEMWLARISPAEKGRKWQTFECPACEISQKRPDRDHEIVLFTEAGRPRKTAR